MRNRVFTNQERLEKMFRLRKDGFSLISLGIIFGVDYTTIYHHCKGQNVPKSSREKQFSIPSIISNVELSVRRKPKTYADYLREEMKRRERILS